MTHNPTTTFSLALWDIEQERRRQRLVEGFTSQHDDGHIRGDLALAGGSYALRAGIWFLEGNDVPDKLTGHGRRYTNVESPPLWPWDQKWWKPKGPRRDLVRAAALLVAEIERIDRLTGDGR